MSSAKKATMKQIILSRNYLAFARKVFLTVCSEIRSIDPYIWVLCQAAVDVFEGKKKRLVISVPLRHGKTTVFTIALIAWELAHRPNAKIMVVCYSPSLAKYISDAVRDVLESSWFQEVFPRTRLRNDHNRSMDFATTAGGLVFCHYLGRGITGRGADLYIFDDPHDVEDAKFPDRLDEAYECFNELRIRLNNPRAARIVIVGHRIDSDDLSGRVLRERGWTQIRLPFIAERDQTYDTSFGVWHRQKDELLRPDQFTEEDVEDRRRRKDFPIAFQQLPPEETWQISPDDFPLFDAVPADAGGIVISIDAAHVPGKRNSFSVFQAWRSAGAKHFLIDQWRGQVTPTELENEAWAFIKRHPPTVVLIEWAGAGIALLAALQRRARGRFSLEAIPTGNRSKIERFSEVVPTIKARSVYLPAGKGWVPPLVEELRRFPRGDADDQVDAMSQFLLWQAVHPDVPLLAPARMCAVLVTSRGEITHFPGPAPMHRAPAFPGGGADGQVYGTIEPPPVPPRPPRVLAVMATPRDCVGQSEQFWPMARPNFKKGMF